MVTMLTLVPVVSAQEPPVDLSGEGNLNAQGDGIAILWGKGTVHLTGSGVL